MYSVSFVQRLTPLPVDYPVESYILNAFPILPLSPVFLSSFPFGFAYTLPVTNEMYHAKSPNPVMPVRTSRRMTSKKGSRCSTAVALGVKLRNLKASGPENALPILTCISIVDAGDEDVM